MKSFLKTMENLLDYNKYQFYILDLDNTMYAENDYLFSAYNEIALNLSRNNNLSQQELYLFLEETFTQEGRTRLFDKFCEKFQITNSTIPNILHILRNHSCPKRLALFPEIASFITKNTRKKFFVLTNGNIIQQKNKIKQLEWKGLDAHINFYFADSIAPKPSNKGLEKIINNHNLKRNESLFIGDSKTDEECAKKSNIDYIDINNFKASYTLQSKA